MAELNRPPGTLKLWDRDFNLLATWQEDEPIPLRFTKDWDGMRVSGVVDRITVVSDET